MVLEAFHPKATVTCDNVIYVAMHSEWDIYAPRDAPQKIVKMGKLPITNHTIGSIRWQQINSMQNAIGHSDHPDQKSWEFLSILGISGN